MITKPNELTNTILSKYLSGLQYCKINRHFNTFDGLFVKDLYCISKIYINDLYINIPIIWLCDDYQSIIYSNNPYV